VGVTGSNPVSSTDLVIFLLVRVAESGVAGPLDVAEYYKWDADVVLVGELLVRSGDPRSSVGEFIAAANTLS
jgi:indole-3-glycerol phosphate synthase